MSLEAAALFFDENVSSSVKRKMVEVLKLSDNDEFDTPKRFIFYFDDFKWFVTKNIDYFINAIH